MVYPEFRRYGVGYSIVSHQTQKHCEPQNASQIIAFFLSQRHISSDENTISNIEKEGVTSLASGRFIKLCLSGRAILSKYVEICSFLDVEKKEELLKRLRV